MLGVRANISSFSSAAKCVRTERTYDVCPYGIHLYVYKLMVVLSKCHLASTIVRLFGVTFIPKRKQCGTHTIPVKDDLHFGTMQRNASIERNIWIFLLCWTVDNE